MFWFKGELHDRQTLELGINEPGLLYGATTFTTLRVYGKSLDHPLTAWQQHGDRLHHTLSRFEWKMPNWDWVRQGAEILAQTYPVLRITLFPDGREWILGRVLPPDLPNRQKEGIAAWVADTPELSRPLADHKTGNYLSAWLASQKAIQQGAVEAILTDDRGHWLETSTGNLWGWKEGTWWTPPLAGGILPGIVRSQLFDWLSQHSHPIQETEWTPQLVQSFETLAYTNCVVQVIPIHSVHHTTPLAYNPHHPDLADLRSLFEETGK